MLDGDLYPRVGDFGFSRFFGLGDQMIQMTMDIGTLMYMAPELFREMNDEQKYSPAVDVWSYGMILYELVTKERPWDREIRAGGQRLTFLSCLQNGILPVVPDYIPPIQKGLIERCLPFDPREKPTFKEIIDEMNNDTDFDFDDTDLDLFREYRTMVIKGLVL
jgi:serine/threonine protein kinase